MDRKKSPFLMINKARLYVAGLTLTWLLSSPCFVYAQGWKYLPKNLAKTPKVPAAMNPALKPGLQKRLLKLDIQFEVNLERAKKQWQAQGKELQPYQPRAYPPQFTNFVAWLNKLESKKLLADQHTSQAIQAVHQAVLNYTALTSQQQAQVNWLVITLERLRNTKLGKFKNGDFYKIAYHPASSPTALPQAQGFHIKQERNGLFKKSERMMQAMALPITSFIFAEDFANPYNIIGLTFHQGFQPTKTRQELEQALDMITPPGYSVRLSTHELGLSHNRHKFRQGFLHIHLEKENTTAGPVPTDVSIELWLGVTPYAGVMDIKTRKIIAPFSDKQIAQNYLILFDKYLTPNARKTLEYIAY